MYSSLNEFKTYLGITGNDRDTELTSYLNSANELLNKLLNVDTFEEQTTVENARFITEGATTVNVYVKNHPVQEIQEIGGTAYSGVSGDDYIILCNRKIMFADKSILNKVNKFGVLTIKYKHGYTAQNIPSDLKTMEMMLASGMFQSHGNEGIASYKLGDESITFGDVNGTSANDIYFSFKTLLNKWKNFILPC